MISAETLIARARQNRLQALAHRREATAAAPAGTAATGCANINAAPRDPQPTVIFTSRRREMLALAS
ncbi:hypothetical protein [Szabonella alba]|uniref:Uncharacterized protein n=1 Tax=Szabonella alba TaxID=2804194 RepID=A0A8K0VFF1_9RHOB|nr:hypothetical protein [Szabonella alba]MBL4918327.1 hypothetical protein [Szabonella alba]